MIEIENVSIRKLNPAAYNPRKIDGATLDRLARGMEEFGIVDPIIINKDGNVIGGHQRIKAAVHASTAVSWFRRRSTEPCFRHGSMLVNLSRAGLLLSVYPAGPGSLDSVTLGHILKKTGQIA